MSGILSGVSDVDAISISMARYARENNQLNIAVIVIVLAMLSNTIVKAVIAMTKGTTEVRRIISYGFGSMILAGLAYIIAAHRYLH